MDTLDDTWRDEAAELGANVKPGWPAWAGEQSPPPQALPDPENARLAREAIETLWPTELVPTDEMIADYIYHDSEDH